MIILNKKKENLIITGEENLDIREYDNEEGIVIDLKYEETQAIEGLRLDPTAVHKAAITLYIANTDILNISNSLDGIELKIKSALLKVTDSLNNTSRYFLELCKSISNSNYQDDTYVIKYNIYLNYSDTEKEWRVSGFAGPINWK